MAANLIGLRDPIFKRRVLQVRTARGHPPAFGLNALEQGSIKPKLQLDHLQDTL
jgi:hypothetical protein